MNIWFAGQLYTYFHRDEATPGVTITWIFKCFPSSLNTCEVCKANSQVGTYIATLGHKIHRKI